MEAMWRSQAQKDERKHMRFIEERNRIRDGVRQQIHWNILRRKRPGASCRELPRQPQERGGGWMLEQMNQQHKEIVKYLR